MIPKKDWKPLGKRHDWTTRNGGEITYELLVKEYNRKLDRFIFNSSKKFKEILELLRLKYGLEYR